MVSEVTDESRPKAIDHRIEKRRFNACVLGGEVLREMDGALSLTHETDTDEAV